jgi:hypothetical protein|tara:strand:+ start:608 stop:1510 length:903 start_codon:yes stop_codon:yes gene_type:complete
MKMYITTPVGGAGLFIYQGYKNAWERAGFEVEFINGLPRNPPQEYHAMVTEGSICQLDLKSVSSFLEKAERVYLLVAPNKYPEPWGLHPNWRSTAPEEFITLANELDNVYLWGFGRVEDVDFFYKWKTIHYVPLAFDHIGYQPVEDSRYERDVVFVGGWADNGFNEKQRIMLENLGEVSKLGLNTGIFINQQISVADEANLLFNSKIALNLHDEYQRVVGLDSNERTFKGLGMTGFMVCDSVSEVERLFPALPTSNSPKEFANLVSRYLDEDLEDTKNKNREDILKNHTYLNRIETLLNL